MENEIIKIIQKHTNQTISLESKLKDDLQLDSFSMMIIITEIETSQNIDINLALIQHIVTVNDFIDCCRKSLTDG